MKKFISSFLLAVTALVAFSTPATASDVYTNSHLWLDSGNPNAPVWDSRGNLQKAANEGIWAGTSFFNVASGSVIAECVLMNGMAKDLKISLHTQRVHILGASITNARGVCKPGGIAGYDGWNVPAPRGAPPSQGQLVLSSLLIFNTRVEFPSGTSIDSYLLDLDPGMTWTITDTIGQGNSNFGLSQLIHRVNQNYQSGLY